MTISKKLLCVCACVAFAMIGCTCGNKSGKCCESQNIEIPEDAIIMDGKSDALLYLERDSSSKEESLWIYDIETKKSRCFLTCHHHRGPSSYSGEDGFVWSRDSIDNICQAKFVDGRTDLIMVGESATTYMQIYVVSDSDALYFTGANRFLGQLFNNGWYVTEYRTYDSDDTYSVVSYYDEKGKLIKTDSCVLQ